MKYCHILISAVLVLIGCSASDPHHADAPSALQVGQLAVSIPKRPLHPGSNEFQFTVVEYDGSLSPPPLTKALRHAEVVIHLHGLDAAPDATSVAQFVENGPDLDLGNGRVLRANYSANLNLAATGAGVAEFVLDRDGEPRRIQVPIRVE